MSAELIVLRFLHIVPGVFWIGSLLFTTFFLQPALQGGGPAAAVMPRLAARRLPLFMMASAMLTILAGVRLMWIVSGGMNPQWIATGMGRTISIGAASALIGFLGGMLITMPAAQRMGKLANGPDAASHGAEIAKLQGRMRVGTIFSTVFLGIALICMAVARYVS